MSETNNYYQRNKDRLITYQKKYYRDNIDKIKVYHQCYDRKRYKINRKPLIQKDDQYVVEQCEKRRLYYRSYYYNHKEIILLKNKLKPKPRKKRPIINKPQFITRFKEELGLTIYFD